MKVTNKDTREMISWILTAGTLLSAIMVLFGGVIFLWQHGQDSWQSELLNTTNYLTSIHQVWIAAADFSPLGVVELGVITLIATQILRVALLVFCYAINKDYWFTGISLFVLSVLIYSFFIK